MTYLRAYQLPLGLVCDLVMHWSYKRIFKVIGGYSRWLTRNETNKNLIRFVIPFAKTATYQTLYSIVKCGTI
jgi:hypothetical protein